MSGGGVCAAHESRAGGSEAVHQHGGRALCIARKVEINMHSKGMDQNMIDVALAIGMPVNISPKYWAEHLGMPYHQAEIRELERPAPGTKAPGLMKLSAGSRSFKRYGYRNRVYRSVPSRVRACLRTPYPSA